MVTNLRLFFSIISLTFLINCGKDLKNKKTDAVYTYRILNENSNIKGYFERQTSIKEDLKTIKILRLSPDRKLLDSIVEKYAIKKNGLKDLKTDEYYLFNQVKDSCYNYKSFNNEVYKLCYLGKISLKLKGKVFKEVDKFKIVQLKEDGVSRYIYFNDKFTLLKDEYISGYSPYFNIELESGL